MSSSETAPGAGMIFVPNVSTTGANYFAVQGLAEGGATTLTVSAPGYAPLTYTVEVDPSGFVIYQPSSDFTTNAIAANTAVRISAVRLVRGTNAYANYQEVRGGLTVPVPVTSSNTAVGVITVSPVNMVAVANSSVFNVIDTAFDPLAGGSTMLSLVQPAGYETISNPSSFRGVQLVATVSP